MSLLVVTAFHKGDVDSAVRLYNWIKELGCINNDVLLVHDPQEDRFMCNRVLLAARRAAKNVIRIITDGKHKRGWPHGPNAAFLAASKYAFDNKRDFLWLEPDCVPIKPNWLPKLELEYSTSKKRYLGGIVTCKPPLPSRVMYGIAVYSRSVYEIAQKNIANNQGVAFDVSMSQDTVPLASPSRCLCISTKDKSVKDVSIGNGIVLYHPDKNGELIDIIKSSTFKRIEGGSSIQMNVTGKTGYHYGDRGDVIYSLPLCRMLGITNLVLCPSDITRERMTRQSAESLASLIENQTYIDSVSFSEREPSGAIDLNKFRELLGQMYDGRYEYHNLSSLQLRSFGFPEWHENDRWLWVTPIKLHKSVVIARSERYHSDSFDWKYILRSFGKSAVFIGSPREHNDFCNLFGNIEYYKTENLLKVAQIIAGSELFIGNQSCPYAIAEGLKHPAILEWINGPSQNCHFSRKGLYYGTEKVSLPKLARKENLNWVAITDKYSGIGNTAYQLFRRQSQFNMSWVKTRFSEMFTKFDADIKLFEQRPHKRSIVIESIPVIHEYVLDEDVVISMWESTRLPKNAVDSINKCKASIVPSQWCHDIYRESGIKIPIYKLPLGVDRGIYKAKEFNRDIKVFTFGASSRFCHDENPRKNIPYIIEAFKLAFQGKSDVQLLIKGYDANNVSDLDPRIKIISEYWTDRKMSEWYQSLDCFVNIPRGGGWELHVHEAMMCGVVPIVLNYSSSLEFVTNGCGYFVDYKLIDADWHVYKGCGQWAVPNMDSLVSILRRAYDNRGELESKRPKAIRAVERLTWDNSASVLDNVLLDIFG